MNRSMSPEETSTPVGDDHDAEGASSQRVRFSNREELDQIGQYRKFNAAAALSFVLGLASVAALASFMSWIVPFAAVLVGVVGLWLAARRDNMGGAVLAWTGIFLGLFFASMAASRFMFDRNVLFSEAEVIGRKWLQLVSEGEDSIAHQAMLHPANRQARGLSVDEYYNKDEDARLAKERIFASSPAKDIMALGPEADVKLLKNHSQGVDLKYGKLIFQTYRVESAGQSPVDTTLIIARSYKEDLGRASWIVADIKMPGDI